MGIVEIDAGNPYLGYASESAFSYALKHIVGVSLSHYADMPENRTERPMTAAARLIAIV